MANLQQPSNPQGGQYLTVIIASLGFLGLITPNPLLTFASFGLLLLMTKLLWRTGEPPVLLVAMAYHWVQACLLTINADVQMKPLEEFGSFHAAQSAAWLTLLGVAAVTVGIRVGTGPNYAPRTQEAVSSLASKLSIRKLFITSLLCMSLANILEIMAASLPSLRQPILAVTNLHWVVVYLFIYTALSQRRGYKELATVLVIEVLVGFLGYFSGFRTILFLSLMAALAVPSSLRGIRLGTAIGLSAAILAMAIFWVGIKKDYRIFLNRGSGDQVVLVSVPERIEKLTQLATDFSTEKMGESWDDFVERLAYIQFFGEAIHTVPDHIPHEDGKLWREAIENALVPRFIHPEKPILDDSVRTGYYTGGFVAGVQEGASISLGYMAESYIDFGPWLMFLPLFLWGVFLGFCYRILVLSTPFPLFGYACGETLILLNATLLETSNAKMVGGMVLGTVVLFVLQKNLAGRILRRLES